MEEKIKINYSIVSRGTEKYNNHGYISVSEQKNAFRYILNVDHGVKEAVINNDYLKFKSGYDIANIAFSRFQLITALMYERHKKDIKNNIIILGFGNIGISCLFYLLDRGYNNITIYIRKTTEYIKNATLIIEKYYNVKVKIINLLENMVPYDTFIDTTGSSLVLENIFENINYNKKIIILSTPRDDNYKISPLTINRKNLTIIGGHEFNEIDTKDRCKIYSNLLIENKEKTYLNQFVNVYKYSTEKLKQIKKQKSNFIEMFKY